MRRYVKIQQLIAAGFDLSRVVPKEGRWEVGCSMCRAILTNGFPRHESGCCNAVDVEDEYEQAC